jgi:hypothetical protein
MELLRLHGMPLRILSIHGLIQVTGRDGHVSLSSRVQGNEHVSADITDLEVSLNLPPVHQIITWVSCYQLQNRARQTLAHMAHGYADTVESAMPGV